METSTVPPAALTAPAPSAPPDYLVRGEPPPLHGGPLTFLRFAKRNHMLTPGYAYLLLRMAWFKLRFRGRYVLFLVVVLTMTVPTQLISTASTGLRSAETHS